jgi:hypothetical protein
VKVIGSFRRCKSERLAVEAAAFILVSGILLAVSSPRSAPWTPLVAWGLVAILLWRPGSWTGASLKPARSIAPAVLAPYTTGLWAYLIGPLFGSIAAVAVYGTVSRFETRTAKVSTIRRTDPPWPPVFRSRRDGLLIASAGVFDAGGDSGGEDGEAGDGEKRDLVSVGDRGEPRCAAVCGH